MPPASALPPLTGPTPIDLVAVSTLVLGGPPTRGVVLMPLLDPEHTRVWPLPETDAELADRRVARLVGEVAADERSESFALIVFTDEPSGAWGARVRGRLATRIGSRLHRAGKHVADAMWVAADGWGCYWCDDPHCAYAGPRPLLELELRLVELRAQ